MTPALRLEAIRKAYHGRPILADVSFEVKEGETVALVGPNGSGKSTLLRIAGTLNRPDAGRVWIGGLDAARDPEGARRQVGLMTQEAPVDEAFTPQEQLQWWIRLFGTSHDAARLLDAAGLPADRPARHLSRGQRQRLALLMALGHDPPLALLDEPFTGLDPEGVRWLEALLLQRQGRRATLMALQPGQEAFADRVERLGGGR
ncbi:MAG: ABC transporter ATP-binding protein [Thermoplasmatota archaeon]